MSIYKDEDDRTWVKQNMMYFCPTLGLTKSYLPEHWKKAENVKSEDLIKSMSK